MPADDIEMQFAIVVKDASTSVSDIISQDPKAMAAYGFSGAEKIFSGNENISPEEEIGLEAIILLQKRPAILINDNTLINVPKEWEILNQHKTTLEKVLPSIGRINVKDHPDGDFMGTGFLVAEDVIMTNAHVAMTFSENRNNTWSFRYKPSIDFKKDLSNGSNEFEIKELIGIHDQYDLSLFRVSFESNSSGKPTPLTVINNFDDSKVKGRTGFVVGYPAADAKRNDPIEMSRIFQNIYNIKRLQPGTLTGFYNGSQDILSHDCSTLGGNSGSAFLDLETGRVMGLHFGGRYLETNRAVALWKLVNDPMLKKAGVNFG
jgi:V8-like Glu-specific endopeptidase